MIQAERWGWRLDGNPGGITNFEGERRGPVTVAGLGTPGARSWLQTANRARLGCIKDGWQLAVPGYIVTRCGARHQIWNQAVCCAALPVGETPLDA